MLGMQLFYQPRICPVYAQGDWKSEFADICSQTDDPMVLSKDELSGLIERCEKLKPLIEKLDESAAKVYRKRLQMCWNLFVFALEAKSKLSTLPTGS